MQSPEKIESEAKKELSRVKTLEDLEQFEVAYFGRKQGKLTEILRSLSSLSERERKALGSKANRLKKSLERSIEQKRESLLSSLLDRNLIKEKIDITRPGDRVLRGHLHPLTHIRMEAENIFTSMGFEIAEGPEIETEYYSFDALNIPAEHPARDLWDTFWLHTNKKERYNLRPHTSPVQIRYMESHHPPFRIIAPGKVYRHEATDASHDVQFWQLEGLMVGKDIAVTHLKYTLQTFFRKLFGSRVYIRLRPSYFPFVEPGFEIDITCVACASKGCRVCKQTGWLELLGAGMVHQRVFEEAGYVRGEWQGFAFGVGLDRLAMMKYKIPDVRLFRMNDIRFLKQF